MNTLLSTFLIIFSLFLISFALINIRQIFTGKEFRGTCATNNPTIKNKVGDCNLCGAKADEACQMPEEK
jgi:hypothetical protein